MHGKLHLGHPRWPFNSPWIFCIPIYARHLGYGWIWAQMTWTTTCVNIFVWVLQGWSIYVDFSVFASALSEIQTKLQLIVVAHSKWPSLWRVTTVRWAAHHHLRKKLAPPTCARSSSICLSKWFCRGIKKRQYLVTKPDKKTMQSKLQSGPTLNSLERLGQVKVHSA